MKAVFFLCCMVVVVSLAVGDDYSINEDFFDKVGLDRMCHGNQTFSHYSMCEKRCDVQNPAPDCPDVIYVGCGCNDGYLPVDHTFTRCVLPQDCP